MTKWLFHYCIKMHNFKDILIKCLKMCRFVFILTSVLALSGFTCLVGQQGVLANQI